MGNGEGVYTGDFGNEGTGGHSHLKYLWKTGEPQKFIVTAQPTNETFTIFSGYYFHPDKKAWMLISSWKAPKGGGYLRGLHSFSENFGVTMVICGGRRCMEANGSGRQKANGSS